MSQTRKILLGVGGVYLLLAIVLAFIVFGSRRQERGVQAAERVQARHLDQPPGPFDINKAVLYLFIAGDPDVLRRWSTSRSRMQARPNRVQTAVEIALRR